MLPNVEADSQAGVIRPRLVIGPVWKDFDLPGAPSPDASNADVMQSSLVEPQAVE